MSKWSDGYVSVNGIKLHYYRTGGNKPPVVFNHGAGDDGLCWTRIAKELEQDYDVIMADGRGHGKSASGKRDYSTASRVADLAGLIQALHLERPVVGGHSMGAHASLHMAAEQPGLARAIFLEDPPIIMPGEELFSSEQFKGRDMGKAMKQFMTAFKLLPGFIGVPLARKMSPIYPDDEIYPWVAAKRRMSFDFLNGMTMLDLDPAASMAALAQISVPTLLFTGDRAKISIVSPETAARLAQSNPLVQVVHLEGASHDIRRTRFDGYMPALQKFLAKVTTQS